MSRLRDALEQVPEDINERAMPFGKYRGTLMKDLPVDYVRWLADPARTGLSPALIGWAKSRIAGL